MFTRTLVQNTKPAIKEKYAQRYERECVLHTRNQKHILQIPQNRTQSFMVQKEERRHQKQISLLKHYEQMELERLTLSKQKTE